MVIYFLDTFLKEEFIEMTFSLEIRGVTREVPVV